MNRSLLIVAATALVMAGLYVGFNRSGRESPGAVAGASAQAPASTPPASVPAASASAPATTAAVSPLPPQGRDPSEAVTSFALSIVQGASRGPDVIRVRQGDKVTLTIDSDRAGTLEVHGYRQEVKIEPSTPATLTFVAAKSGRFGVDLHGRDGAHIEVSALEVQPR